MLALAFFSLCSIVSAQKIWEKPYEKWSKDDALDVVSSSPWAQTFQSKLSQAANGIRQTTIDQLDSVNSGGGGRNAGSISRSGGYPPVVARLHSGLPIRQAITRGRQLAAGYDKMDAQKKAEFDEASKKFLDCAICENYYVISITKIPDSTNQSTEDAIFETFTLKDLKGDVWLVNDKGEQRELVQFTPPKRMGESAYFFFARKDDKGNVLIAPDSKNFKMVFNNGFFGPKNRYAPMLPKNFEFSVAKLTVDGKMLF